MTGRRTRRPLVALVAAGWLGAMAVPGVILYRSFAASGPVGTTAAAPGASATPSTVGDEAPPVPLTPGGSDPDPQGYELRGGVRERKPRNEPGFAWPVSGRITSPYGVRARGTDFHQGVDIGCGTGVPIRASTAGRVAWAGVAPVYGNAVVLQHPAGYRTLYAHLSRIGVRAGQAVEAGRTIGLCGSTGHSTGPHLHFEIRWDGHVWDPLWYLPRRPVSPPR